MADVILTANLQLEASVKAFVDDIVRQVNEIEKGIQSKLNGRPLHIDIALNTSASKELQNLTAQFEKAANAATRLNQITNWINSLKQSVDGVGNTVKTTQLAINKIAESYGASTRRVTNELEDQNKAYAENKKLIEATKKAEENAAKTQNESSKATSKQIESKKALAEQELKVGKSAQKATKPVKESAKAIASEGKSARISTKDKSELAEAEGDIGKQADKTAKSERSLITSGGNNNSKTKHEYIAAYRELAKVKNDLEIDSIAEKYGMQGTNARTELEEMLQDRVNSKRAAFMESMGKAYSSSTVADVDEQLRIIDKTLAVKAADAVDAAGETRRKSIEDKAKKDIAVFDKAEKNYLEAYEDRAKAQSELDLKLISGNLGQKEWEALNDDLTDKKNNEMKLLADYNDALDKVYSSDEERTQKVAELSAKQISIDNKYGKKRAKALDDNAAEQLQIIKDAGEKEIAERNGRITELVKNYAKESKTYAGQLKELLNIPDDGRGSRSDLERQSDETFERMQQWREQLMEFKDDSNFEKLTSGELAGASKAWDVYLNQELKAAEKSAQAISDAKVKETKRIAAESAKEEKKEAANKAKEAKKTASDTAKAEKVEQAKASRQTKSDDSFVTKQINDQAKAVREAYGAYNEARKAADFAQSKGTDPKEIAEGLAAQATALDKYNQALATFENYTNIANSNNSFVKAQEAARAATQKNQKELAKYDSEFEKYQNDHSKKTIRQGTEEYIKAMSQISDMQQQADKILGWTKAGEATSGQSKGIFDGLKNMVNAGFFKELQKELDSGNMTVDKFADIYTRYKDVMNAGEKIIRDEGNAKPAGQKTLFQNLGATMFSDDAVEQAVKQYLTLYRVIQEVAKAVKKMIETSIELNDAMTELNIVTNASGYEMDKYQDTVLKSASNLGVSATSLISSATTYARLGYSLDDSRQLSEYTAMLEKVGGIETSDAQDAITSIIKAFGDEVSVDNMESVMGKLVAVGNNFPISVEQIAAGMNSASSSLAAGGNTFEQSVALLTAANTTVQNASKSATGLRTITARIRNTTADLEELGETDFTAAKYDELVSALTKQKVALTDANGEYRSTYDIIKDIAGVWDEMTSQEQAALATTLAGTRQQNIFFSLIEQFEEAENAFELMQSGAANNALTESYGKYLDSTTAHLNKFKAAFQELSSTEFSPEFLNFFIDIGTGALGAVNYINDLSGGLLNLRTILGTFAAKNFFGDALSLLTGHSHTFGSQIKGVLGIVGAITAAVSVISTVYDWIHTSYDEARSEYEEMSAAREEEFGEGSRYDELINKQRLLTNAERAELSILESRKKLMDEQIRQQKETAFDIWQKENGSGASKTYYETVDDISVGATGEVAYVTSQKALGSLSVDKANLVDLQQGLVSLANDYKSGSIYYSEFADGISSWLGEYQEYYNMLSEYSDMQLTTEQQQFKDLYEAETNALGVMRSETEKAAQSEYDLNKRKYEEINDLITEYGGSPADYAARQKALDNMLDSEKRLKQINKDTFKDAAKQASSFTDEVDKASEELDNLSEKLKNVKEKGDLATTISTMYQGAQENIEKGRTGTESVAETIEALFDPSQLAEWGYDYNKAVEAMGAEGGLYNAVFGKDVKDQGLALWDYLEANSAALDGLGVHISQVGDEMLFSYDSMAAFSEAMSVLNGGVKFSETALTSMLDLLDAFGFQTMLSGEEVGTLNDYINAFSSDAKAAGTSTGDYLNDAITGLAELGKTPFEISNILKAIAESGDNSLLASLIGNITPEEFGKRIKEIVDGVDYSNLSQSALSELSKTLSSKNTGLGNRIEQYAQGLLDMGHNAGEAYSILTQMAAAGIGDLGIDTSEEGLANLKATIDQMARDQVINVDGAAEAIALLQDVQGAVQKLIDTANIKITISAVADDTAQDIIDGTAAENAEDTAAAMGDSAEAAADASAPDTRAESKWSRLKNTVAEVWDNAPFRNQKDEISDAADSMNEMAVAASEVSESTGDTAKSAKDVANATGGGGTGKSNIGVDTNQALAIPDAMRGIREAMAESGEDGSIEIPIDADPSGAISGAAEAQAAINSVTGKTVSINVVTSGGANLNIGAGAARAKGDKNFKGGTALVNEKGPELISDNGTAYIAGGGKPTLANIGKGATILTAEETKHALRGKLSSIKTKPIPGFDGGKDYGVFGDSIGAAIAAILKKPKGSGGGGKKKDPAKEFEEQLNKKKHQLKMEKITEEEYLDWLEKAYKKAYKKNTKEYWKYQEEVYEGRKKLFQDWLKDQENMIEESQRTSDNYDQTIQAYEDMIAAVKKKLEEAYDYGLTDSDDWVQELKGDIWEYEDAIRDVFSAMMDDQEFAIQKLEEEAENEGDNAAQIAIYYNNMIQQVLAQIDKAHAMGLDDTTDWVQELYKLLWDYQDELKDIEEESEEDSEDRLDDLVQYRIKMIRQQLEDEKEAYDERLSQLQKFIDKQKEMLDDADEEEQYLEDQAEKRKAVADLEAQIEQLRYDDSAWATKKRMELAEELADKQKELDDFEKDHALEKTKEQLDDIYELSEESVEQHNKTIDEKLDDMEYLYNQALEDIRNNSEALYKEMVAYELKYESGTIDAIKKRWDDAYDSLKKYQEIHDEFYKGIDLKSTDTFNIADSGYASGTSLASKGLHRLYENGPEALFTSSNGNTYRMFTGGEKVLNAASTSFLYDFANSRGANLGISKEVSALGAVTKSMLGAQIKMGDIIINGNANEATVSEIRRAQRENVEYMLKEFNRLNR